MSLQQKYVKVLSGILPAGAVGMSLLLGSTAPTAASEHPHNRATFLRIEIRSRKGWPPFVRRSRR